MAGTQLAVRKFSIFDKDILGLPDDTNDNLKKINHYKQALKDEIKGIDTKLDQVVYKCQQDFLHSYQAWIKSKEQDYSVLVSKLQEKLSQKSDQELKILELRQMLIDEQDKRRELQKRKDKSDEEIHRLKQLIEQIKDDCEGYKESAKKAVEKTKLMEVQNREMAEKMKEMEEKMKEEKQKSSLMMINQTNMNLQSAMSYGDELIDQSGHILRFKGFLDHLFSSDLKNAEIKNQLVFYFQALESGYRNKIAKLYQQIRELQEQVHSSPLKKVSPNKPSITQLSQGQDSMILGTSPSKQSTSRNIMKLSSILSSRDKLFSDRGSLQAPRFSKNPLHDLNKSELLQRNTDRSSSIEYLPRLDVVPNQEKLTLNPLMTIRNKKNKVIKGQYEIYQ